MLSCYQWLQGETSGKIFLDWRNSSLWAFVIALTILWCVLLVSFLNRSPQWRKIRQRVSLAGLIGLATVPILMLIAASPKTYPPVDPSTGGPTGSSLLGSTLMVIGLMLLLPRATDVEGRGKAGLGTWIFFGISWITFGVTEAIGGGHFDAWQIGAMLMLLPWAWLIPRDWSDFKWPPQTRAWRHAMIVWWALLVISGVAMYSPGILDHIKFTQALVAHSHLAMAGFTTAFCATILSLLTRRSIGGTRSVMLWNGAAFTMIITLAAMGWREGNSSEWMIIHAGWREAGMMIRTACGALMLGTSIGWLIQFSKS
jgi:cytochrome c oxidase cbb3-type subunit 1